MTPFRQGMEDRRTGRALEDCPFVQGSQDQDEWRRGWLIASTSSRLMPQITIPRPEPRAG